MRPDTEFLSRSKLRQGIGSFLHTARIILRNLQQRKYEPEIAHLSRFLSPGDLCLHIGASDGRHTVVMSRLVADGEIYCFEPSRYTLGILNRVLKFHRIHNVKTYNVAISDRFGNTNLITPIKRNGHVGRSFAFLSDEVPNLQFLRETRGFRDVIVEPVRMWTIDGFCQDNQLESIQFIRCDVEGAEMLVIRGADQVIRKNRPVMLLEVHPHSLRDHFNSSAEDLYKLLSSWKYKSFYVEGDALLEAKRFFEEPWRDYFCVPEEKLEYFRNFSHQADPPSRGL